MYYLFVNKSSKTPIYQQLASSIRLAISDHVLNHDDQLPTDEDICVQFGISNIVVKQAYSVLASEHLITRIRGKGTYVTTVPQIEATFSDFRQLDQQFSNLGVTKKLNLIEVIDHHDLAYSYLNLKEGDLAYRITLSAIYQKTPVYCQEMVLPCSWFPNLDKVFINPNYSVSMLAKDMYQLPLAHSSHDFSLENLLSSTSQMLQVTRHEAAYVFRSTYRDTHKKPLFFIQSTYPGRYLKLTYKQENQ
jgi:DNA-binding GntR family transcriptional regulator